MSVASALEWINPFDGDAGISGLAWVPVIGSACTTNKNAYSWSSGLKGTLIGGAGGVAGGLMGWKLGSNFGTIGKVAGGVIGAWAGKKLAKEAGKDIGAAIDYEKAATKETGKKDTGRFLKAMGSNLLTSGQNYDGKTEINSDPDPDVN